MARAPRCLVPNGIYHVIARGNRRQAIFEDQEDRTLFLWLLARVVTLFGWHCSAYCLMTNHYHLVVETPHANLSAGMHSLNGRYARAFNDRHGHEGHLLERRFHAVLVESDGHLLELARYLALNPVRAGLCSHPLDWAGSSYPIIVSGASPPTFLDAHRFLELFGTEATGGRRSLRAFVEGGQPLGVAA